MSFDSGPQTSLSDMIQGQGAATLLASYDETALCSVSFRLVVVTTFRVSTAQGKQGNWLKKIHAGKHREFGNFAKTHGNWFAQVVNSLILKVKDILLFAVEISNFVLTLDKYAKAVLCL